MRRSQSFFLTLILMAVGSGVARVAVEMTQADLTRPRNRLAR